MTDFQLTLLFLGIVIAVINTILRKKYYTTVLQDGRKQDIFNNGPPLIDRIYKTNTAIGLTLLLIFTVDAVWTSFEIILNR